MPMHFWKWKIMRRLQRYCNNWMGLSFRAEIWESNIKKVILDKESLTKNDPIIIITPTLIGPRFSKEEISRSDLKLPHLEGDQDLPQVLKGRSLSVKSTVLKDVMMIALVQIVLPDTIEKTTLQRKKSRLNKYSTITKLLASIKTIDINPAINNLSVCQMKITNTEKIETHSKKIFVMMILNNFQSLRKDKEVTVGNLTIQKERISLIPRKKRNKILI